MKQTPRSKAAFKLTGLMEGGYILLVSTCVEVVILPLKIAVRNTKLTFGLKLNDKGWRTD